MAGVVVVDVENQAIPMLGVSDSSGHLKLGSQDWRGWFLGLFHN